MTISGNYYSVTSIDKETAKLLTYYTKREISVLVENGCLDIEIEKYYDIICSFANGKPIQYKMNNKIYAVIDELPILDACCTEFAVWDGY